MAEKRKSTDAAGPAPSKKSKPTPGPRKGISVGPANLPDGQWKRRNQRIKRSLVTKAKLRGEYRKQQSRGGPEGEANELRYYAQEEEEDRARSRQERVEAQGSDDEEGDDDKGPETVADSETPHPDRAAMMERGPSAEPAPVAEEGGEQRRKQRRARPVPFAREQGLAEQRRREAEERTENIRRAHEERARKTEERERFRRAMAKARTGGKNGQRKLGRESGVLLEKVKRIMSER